MQEIIVLTAPMGKQNRGKEPVGCVTTERQNAWYAVLPEDRRAPWSRTLGRRPRGRVIGKARTPQEKELRRWQAHNQM